MALSGELLDLILEGGPKVNLRGWIELMLLLLDCLNMDIRLADELNDS